MNFGRYILILFDPGSELIRTPSFSVFYQKEKSTWNIALLVLSTILKNFFISFIVESKMLTESLTEKLLRQVGWQGRVQNIWNSPHDVRSPDSRVLTQTFSPNFSLLAFDERWFLSLWYTSIQVFIWKKTTHMLNVYQSKQKYLRSPMERASDYCLTIEPFIRYTGFQARFCEK